MYNEAIEMYVEAGTATRTLKAKKSGVDEKYVNFFNVSGDWSKAYSLCTQFDQSESGVNLLVAKGKTYEQMGKLHEAEKLYLTIQQPDLAISMYKENRQYDQVRNRVISKSEF